MVISYYCTRDSSSRRNDVLLLKTKSQVVLAFQRRYAGQSFALHVL